MKFFELKLRLIAPLVLLCCFVFFGTQSAQAATCTVLTDGARHSATTPTVVMLRSTVSTQPGSTAGTGETSDCSSLEAVQAMAAPLGLNVEIDGDTTWGAKTQSDFATYSAIVLGDPGCVSGTAPITAAQNNVGVWGGAIAGPVALVGTDPVFHFVNNRNTDGTETPQGTTAAQLTQNAIAYGTSVSGKTGAYISLSCYYASSLAGTSVPVLSPFGSFTVQGTNWSVSTIVASSNPLVNTPNMLTNTGLSNWGNSSHEGFNSLPGNFTAVVNTQFSSTSTPVLPYILTGPGGETQTKTLGPPGTTTTYTFNTDSYKITGTNNTGGESLTITAFLIPKSAFPPFTVTNRTTGATNTETCVPYGDYSAALGVDTCVEFQATCTTTAGATCNFHYVLATGYDLPADLPAIGAPDFVVLHGQPCPLRSTSSVVSIFDAYEVSIKDPTDVASSDGPSCFVATYVPNAPPITTGVGFVGWGSPVDNSALNQVQAGATRPLSFFFYDNNGNPVTNLAYCDLPSSTAGVCSNPSMTATATMPWINIASVAIPCQAGAPVNTTTNDTTISTTGGSPFQNNGSGAYQINWKTMKSWQGFCANVQVTYSTGGAANVVLFPASFGFQFQ